AAHEQRPVLKMWADTLNIKGPNADGTIRPRGNELLIECKGVTGPPQLPLQRTQGGLQPPARAFLDHEPTLERSGERGGLFQAGPLRGKVDFVLFNAPLGGFQRRLFETEIHQPCTQDCTDNETRHQKSKY